MSKGIKSKTDRTHGLNISPAASDLWRRGIKLSEIYPSVELEQNRLQVNTPSDFRMHAALTEREQVRNKKEERE